MALETAAHHKLHRQHQDDSNVCPPGDRGTDAAAVKPTIPIDTQVSPTGDRDCDDKK
jgi:hypothetical protein